MTNYGEQYQYGYADGALDKLQEFSSVFQRVVDEILDEADALYEEESILMTLEEAFSKLHDKLRDRGVI